jgi:hypothetical protein
MLIIRGCALLFCSACAFVLTAQAQQPFYTDNSDVTPRHHFHFEFSNEFDVLQRSLYPSRFQNTADAELDYGLAHNLEIGIEAPILTIFNAEAAPFRHPTGLGDTNFSAKYNFHHEREGSRLPALSIALNLEIPTGNVRRQLGSGLADYYMNGVMQKSVSSKTMLRLNGGILFSGNTTTGVIGIKTRGTVLTGGASLVKQYTKRFDFGAEITGAFTRNFDLSKGQLQTLVGGNYALRNNLTLDFGLVGGRFSGSPRVGAQLGFSLDF